MTTASCLEDVMGDETQGRPAERGRRFTDRGARFTRRRFLGSAGTVVAVVGTGLFVAGCQFDDGAYQGKDVNQGGGTGQSSTSGQNAGSGKSGSDSKSAGSSGSQSGASS
jgi:hypothetical protein